MDCSVIGLLGYSGGVLMFCPRNGVPHNPKISLGLGFTGCCLWTGAKSTVVSASPVWQGVGYAWPTLSGLGSAFLADYWLADYRGLVLALYSFDLVYSLGWRAVLDLAYKAYGVFMQPADHAVAFPFTVYPVYG